MCGMASAMPIRSRSVPPSAWIIREITPSVGLKNRMRMPTITTVEMKCGM